ncbi:hypothetical protein TNCV_1461881 [Trichonephila clavipes]|nr:hypothetical protein TNCV_1461881 [Trichonephila clavipes]
MHHVPEQKIIGDINVFKVQWSSGSVSRFHTISPSSIPPLNKVDSAFHPYCSGSINEYQACLRVSHQIDHLIQISAHAPQRRMLDSGLHGHIRLSLMGCCATEF